VVDRCFVPLAKGAGWRGLVVTREHKTNGLGCCFGIAIELIDLRDTRASNDLPAADIESRKLKVTCSGKEWINSLSP